MSGSKDGHSYINHLHCLETTIDLLQKAGKPMPLGSIVSFNPEFWDVLKQIAVTEGLSVAALIRHVDYKTFTFFLKERAKG